MFWKTGGWGNSLLCVPSCFMGCALMAATLPLWGGSPKLPRRLTTDGHFKQRPVWSPNRSQICLSRHADATITLWLYDPANAAARRLTDRTLPEYDATWSPDGKELAFCCVSQAGTQGNVDVCIVNRETSQIRTLLGDAGKLSHEESPAWSPDGKWIALTSTRDGNQEIYIIDTEGKEPRRITQDPGLDAHPTWTPDGRHLLFATNRWGDLEIARVDISGEQVERLTTSKGLDDYPVVSPDGRLIAFLSNRDGQYEVLVMDAAGGNIRNISQHEALDNFPAWSPDGDLTWVSDRDGGFDLYLVPKDAIPD